MNKHNIQTQRNDSVLVITTIIIRVTIINEESYCKKAVRSILYSDIDVCVRENLSVCC